MTRYLDKYYSVKGLDFVDWFRAVAAITLFLAGCVVNQSWVIGRMGIAVTVVGVFAAIHLAVSIVNRRGVIQRRFHRRRVNRRDGEREVKRTGDPLAAQRDVTKQYVTVAFVALTLIGTLGSNQSAPNHELIAAAYGLCGAIVAGLLLLERLSGWPHSKAGYRVISVGYHLMTWSLLFGVLCVVISLGN